MDISFEQFDVNGIGAINSCSVLRAIALSYIAITGDSAAADSALALPELLIAYRR